MRLPGEIRERKDRQKEREKTGIGVSDEEETTAEERQRWKLLMQKPDRYMIQ